MAKQWISLLLLVCICYTEISNGEDVELDLEKPPLINFGPLTGDKEVEKYHSAQKIPLDFNITYFGSRYNSIYISKDGLIGFVENTKYKEVTWSEGIPNPDADLPFMAPFYHDGYDPTDKGPTTYNGRIYYRLIYAMHLDTEAGKKSRHHQKNVELLKYLDQYVQEAAINALDNFKTELAAIITWDDVTDSESEADSACDPHKDDKKCKSATFQAVIIADKKHTFVMFNYLDMDIPVQQYYQAGFNGGYERGWMDVIPCLGGCGSGGSELNSTLLNNMPNLNGSDYKGRYFLNVGGERIVRGGCLPPSISAGIVELFPREVGMFGGEKLEVSGKCLKAQSTIYCKFSQGSTTFRSEGMTTNGMKGYCPVPKMTVRGSIKVWWSSDGENWSASKDITVVVPWMVDDVNSQMTESQLMPFFKQKANYLTIEWSPKGISSNNEAKVQIKLIGYREMSDKVEYKELGVLGTVKNNEGGFTFRADDHACSTNCEAFKMGLLEVGLVKEYYGDASKRVAIRYGPIPLGWYVNDNLSKSKGAEWSKDMCRRWYDKESKKDKKWIDWVQKCPCNLDQALADFGRWQAHPNCDLFSGKKCTFRSASHCVSSVKPSFGAGNLCCYSSDKTLIHNQLSFHGGSPSVSHALGVEPYSLPGKVPYLSYMENDVIPYVHCCQWMRDDSDLCHHYTKLRPTIDCPDYEAPGLALVRGDPHITTFDGSTYRFGGQGDFWLVKLPDIHIQGRFQPRRGSWDLGILAEMGTWKPTALTHLAIQGSGEQIQIYPAPESAVTRRGLDVVIGNERYFFNTMSTKWQEFGGMAVINNAASMKDNPHNNFTIITNDAGINVVVVNNLLHVTVALPPSMKNKGPAKGMGLLGMYDGNPDNDYVSSSGKQESSEVDPEGLFKNFSMTWAVSEAESMFPNQLSAHAFGKYNKEQQYHSYDDIPSDFEEAPSELQINSTCDDDEYCKWDYRITGSEKVAMATKEVNELFSYLQESATGVENCGLPAIGDMAVITDNDFSVGEEFIVTGCHGDHKFDGKAAFKCVKERLDVAKGEGRDDYGHVITDKENVKHIVHWVPKPRTICEESEEDKRKITGEPESGESAGSSTGMIVGIVIGVIVAIIIVVVVVVIIRKKRKGGSENIEKQKEDKEDGTDQPMMSRDKGQEGASVSAV